MNKALSDASSQVTLVQNRLHYWSDRLDQANASVAEAGGNIRGYGYGLQSFQYHPGLRDFQARANHAQSKVNEFQKAYDGIKTGIEELNRQKSMLEDDFNKAGCS